MWQYLAKTTLTAIVIVGVAELGKRSSLAGAVLASLPLTSLLAFVWLYYDTGDVQKVASLSTGVFWLVIPSLPLFLVLPALLRLGWNFWGALAASCAVTVLVYVAMVWGLERMGVKI